MSPHRLKDLLDQLVGEMVRGGLTLDEGRRAFEKCFIEQALAGSDGHLSRTADRLGVHRNSLARKMDEYKVRRR